MKLRQPLERNILLWVLLLNAGFSKAYKGWLLVTIIVFRRTAIYR